MAVKSEPAENFFLDFLNCSGKEDVPDILPEGRMPDVPWPEVPVLFCSVAMGNFARLRSDVKII